jgi:protein-L-isoaspartate(D-aspartate) O-methyltransferase
MRKNSPRPFPRFVHYGRIVLPLGPDEAQRLTVVDKGADGRTSVRELIRVRFSRLETVV